MCVLWATFASLASGQRALPWWGNAIAVAQDGGDGYYACLRRGNCIHAAADRTRKDYLTRPSRNHTGRFQLLAILCKTSRVQFNMQSSTVVTFRALVMLGCLVAIPLVALCGRSLPELVDSLWAAGVATAQSSPSEPAGESAFRPFSPVDTQDPRATSQTLPQYPEQPRVLPSQTPESLATAGGTSGVVPVAYNYQTKPGGVRPTVGQLEKNPESNKYARVQGRLQQLGAVYYVLEFWGGERQLYRFYCRVAVAGDPNFTVDFNDTRADPLQAMSGVLKQVETWHRQQPGTF